MKPFTENQLKYLNNILEFFVRDSMDGPEISYIGKLMDRGEYSTTKLSIGRNTKSVGSEIYSSDSALIDSWKSFMVERRRESIILRMNNHLEKFLIGKDLLEVYVTNCENEIQNGYPNFDNNPNIQSFQERKELTDVNNISSAFDWRNGNEIDWSVLHKEYEDSK